MAKGSQYEREICELLSKWWSNNTSTDWFWRSSNSGGRATVRGKKGKTTAGHAGDVAATCQEGESLTKLITIEIKRGYNKFTFADCLDKAKGAKEQTVEGFIRQASEAANNAKTQNWLLIHKRDRRTAMIFMSSGLQYELNRIGKIEDEPRTLVTFDFFDKNHKWWTITGMKLTAFLKKYTPEIVKKLRA